jgi:hypothetical protein
MRRRIAGVFAALLLALAGVLVTQPGAAAAVWSCHLATVRTSSGAVFRAEAWCDFGAGGVRSNLWCTDGWRDLLVHGPWQPAGVRSIAICGGGRWATDWWYETF